MPSTHRTRLSALLLECKLGQPCLDLNLDIHGGFQAEKIGRIKAEKAMEASAATNSKQAKQAQAQQLEQEALESKIGGMEKRLAAAMEAATEKEHAALQSQQQSARAHEQAMEGVMQQHKEAIGKLQVPS